MDKKEKIDREVKKTIQLFEEVESVKADAYFYTRLKARMDAESDKKQQLFGLDIINILRPVLLTGIVTINIITFLFIMRANEPTREIQIQSFAESYGLNTTESLPFE